MGEFVELGGSNMALRVNEDYYEGTFDFYNNKVKQVDEKIESFKANCDNLFGLVSFGTQLDTILTGKATAFYEKSKSSMQYIMNQTQTYLEEFLDGVYDNDTLS